MEYHDVASINDLAEGSLLGVALPNGVRVCLVRCSGSVVALPDECTHQAMPLSAGELLPDGTIECAWHGARFDCRTGEVRRGPATDDVAPYDIRIERERILVRPPGVTGA